MTTRKTALVRGWKLRAYLDTCPRIITVAGVARALRELPRTIQRDLRRLEDEGILRCDGRKPLRWWRA